MATPIMAEDNDLDGAVLPSPEGQAIVDTVFESLLKDIVSGAYASGVRLPAERELSRKLGASRPTLREALRRLTEWNLVEPRRGSGIVVRAYRDWSIEVIAGYLRYGKPDANQPSIAQILLDMLSVRRAVIVEVIRLTGPRIPKDGTAGARSAMARAWSNRDQVSFAREDFEIMRQIAEAAKFTPGMWLLNQIADLWIDAATTVRFAVRPPDDYVGIHAKFFDLIEAGDVDAACSHMAAYLLRHDKNIAKLLGAPQAAEPV
jgi:GntR family transcriptional repressor for pyruvate dehydrogenase complex